jgi:hypothetical protein
MLVFKRSIAVWICAAELAALEPRLDCTELDAVELGASELAELETTELEAAMLEEL